MKHLQNLVIFICCLIGGCNETFAQRSNDQLPAGSVPNAFSGYLLNKLDTTAITGREAWLYFGGGLSSRAVLWGDMKAYVGSITPTTARNLIYADSYTDNVDASFNGTNFNIGSAIYKGLQALNSLGGGTLVLGAKRYLPVMGIGVAITYDNIRLVGQGPGEYAKDCKTITGGTVIDGPIYHWSNGFSMENIGVDCGKTITDTYYGGNALDCISISRLDTTHKSNIYFNHITTLGYSPSAPYHSLATAYSYNVFIDNIRTCYNIYGIVIKSTNVKVGKVMTFAHNTCGLIIKSDSVCHTNSVSLGSFLYKISPEGAAPYATATTANGIILNAFQGQYLGNISIADAAIYNATVGLSFLDSGGGIVDVNAGNITTINCNSSVSKSGTAVDRIHIGTINAIDPTSGIYTNSISGSGFSTSIDAINGLCHGTAALYGIAEFNTEYLQVSKIKLDNFQNAYYCSIGTTANVKVDNEIFHTVTSRSYGGGSEVPNRSLPDGLVISNAPLSSTVYPIAGTTGANIIFNNVNAIRTGTDNSFNIDANGVNALKFYNPSGTVLGIIGTPTTFLADFSGSYSARSITDYAFQNATFEPIGVDLRKTGGTLSGPLNINLNGSNSPAAGAYYGLSNTANNSGWFIQLNGSKGIDYWYTGAAQAVKANLDSLGNFTANSFIGSAANLTGFPTFNQNTTGSAAKLTTARNINGVAFDGTANITVTAAANTLTGSTLASGVTASSLTSVGTLTNLGVSGAITQSPAVGANINNYMRTNAGNRTSTSSLNPGLSVYDDGGSFYGIDLGYNATRSHYRLRLSYSQYEEFSIASNSVLPTGQSSHTDRIVVDGNGVLNALYGVDLNSTKITNVANGTLTNDAVNYGQLSLKADVTSLASYQTSIYHSSVSTTGVGGTSLSISIPTQANTNYMVTVVPTNALTAVNYYITGKTTTQFTINFTTGLTGTIAFDFSIIP